MTEAARVLKADGVFATFASRRRVDVVMGALREARPDSKLAPLQLASWVHNQGHPVGDGMLRPEHEPIIFSGRLHTLTDESRAFRPYQSPHVVNRKPVRRNTAARGFKPTVYTPHPVGPMAGTVIQLTRVKPKSERLDHPTQKPQRLMEHLVSLCSRPGALILDPFLGSGTTAAAAVARGRKFIGIDRDPAYCEMARRRVLDGAPLLAGRIA